LTYVLDTNIFIAGLNGNTKVLRRLGALNPEDIVLCAPVLAELEYGARFSGRVEANLEKIRTLSGRMHFQVFGDAAARRFGTLKAELRRRGAPKADFDLSIAAIAFDLEATLVSDDRAFHEDPIPGLAVENWLLG
jgi:tRNA(fMet)-specific endonuclease VapC